MDAEAPGRVAREILVSFEDEEPKVAVFEDGRLVEVDFDRPQSRRTVGNVYLGRVQNVLPGMQAAFVDIGLERNAFLFVDDARPGGGLDADLDVGDALPKGAPAGIADLVHPGQELLVQVGKEPAGSKGARVTRALTLPGRHLVLMPGLDFVGVSRRIRQSEERERLRAIGRQVRAPGVGLIVRTAAEGAVEAELLADWGLLVATWQEIVRRSRLAKAPALVYRDLDIIQRVVRDQLHGDVRAVVVDQADELEHLKGLLACSTPDLLPVLSLAGRREMLQGLFTARGVDEELERALGRRVSLRSGGYLVVDQTEALTAIDVNTGRYVGDAAEANLEETFLAANLEAVGEIARQIRLRDIGGIIIVDFIDMEPPEHRQRVLAELAAACAADRGRPQVLGITKLGLVEMTRKKRRQNLRELLTKPCAVCEGRGRVPNEEAISRRLRRQIRIALAGSTAEAMLVEVHPSVAAMLIGPGGEALKVIERDSGRTVFIRGAADCQPSDLRICARGSRREVEALALPVREGQVLELQIQSPHASSARDGIGRVDGYVIDVLDGAGHSGRRVRVEIVKAFRTYAKARIV